MTVLLVLLTLIAFLTADYVIQRARAAQAEEEEFLRADAFQTPPAGLCLAPNHTWTTKDGAGVYAVGIDEFLGRLVGAAERILLPREGEMVGPEHAAIGLAARSGSLDLSAPLAGRVVSVNREALENPAIVRKDPYRQGWLMKVKVEAQRPPAHHALEGMTAVQWMKRELELAKEFLAGVPGAAAFSTMQDGGLPSEGILNQYGDDTWRQFAGKFATLRDPAERNASHTAQR